ncbi:MAG: hypothetical protein RMM53_11590, partial [Bacteroidia bacterium]|nr:hypothetical protein [Bacteroidia bacterium]MDW8334849.1 hypothetical protein [Bacteroidia bacterium]
IPNAIKLARRIESGQSDEDLSIVPVPQTELLQSLIGPDGKIKSGNWGAIHLRAPEIYRKIVAAAKDKLVPLRTVANVKRGFTTGNNDFFYLEDRTEEVESWTDEEYYGYLGVRRGSVKDYDWNEVGWYYSELLKYCVILERRYLKPVFVSQKKDAKGLEVDVGLLKHRVLLCDESPEILALNGPHLARYIQAAENMGLHNAVTVSGRKLWYNLVPHATVGDFIFPYLVFEVFRVMDNRKARVYSSNNNFDVVLKDEIKRHRDWELVADATFLCVNSMIFRFDVELNASYMGEGLTNVRTWVFSEGLSANPMLLAEQYGSRFEEILSLIRSREPLPIFEEVEREDRRALDGLIFSALGLPLEWLEELYAAACELRARRTAKAASVKTTKTKGGMSEEEALGLLERKFGYEIRRYEDLLGGSRVRAVYVPGCSRRGSRSWKAGGDLFGGLRAEFGEGAAIEFDHAEQMRLFAFFYDELGFREGTLELPRDAAVCARVLGELKADYARNAELIERFLASARAKTTFSRAYLRLLMRE